MKLNRRIGQERRGRARRLTSRRKRWLVAAGAFGILIGLGINWTNHHLEMTASRSTIVRAPADKLYHLTNQSRVDYGRKPLVRSLKLDKIARQGATWEAVNHALRDVLANCYPGGGNAGVGLSVRKIHRAFMHSLPHRQNILDKRYSRVGIGIARDALGQLWAIEIFC